MTSRRQDHEIILVNVAIEVGVERAISRDREVTPSRGNSPGRHCEARTPRRRDRIVPREGRLSTSVVSPPTIDTERRTPLLPLGAKNISTNLVEQGTSSTADPGKEGCS
ncbi:hypothetical protein ACJJTC_007132 [Scirpophaga incertulas]